MNVSYFVDKFCIYIFSRIFLGGLDKSALVDFDRAAITQRAIREQAAADRKRQEQKSYQRLSVRDLARDSERVSKVFQRTKEYNPANVK